MTPPPTPIALLRATESKRPGAWMLSGPWLGLVIDARLKARQAEEVCLRPARLRSRLALDAASTPRHD